jgi:hypothetical protein
MTQKNTSNLVPSVSKKPHELSKIQKQFNTKTNKVKSIKEDIELIQTAIPILKQRIHTEFVPLRKEIAKNQADIIVLFDAALYEKTLTKNDKEKLKGFIVNHAMVLIDRYQHTELIAIFNKYSEDTYAEIQEAGAKEGKRMMAEMFENMGVKVDLDDIDFTNIDEAMENITEKFAENIGEAKERMANEAEEQEELRKSKRKKNSQEIAQEKLQAQQKEAMSKTLKELYMQLVKEFHPDSEQDVEKKAWKTEVMKKITTAYDAKDFFGLLKLQLEFEQRDAKSFDDLPDSKLQHFIKILDDQIRDLKMELDMLQNPPMLPRELEDISELLQQPKKIEKNFKDRKNYLQEMLEETKEDLYSFKDTKAIKEFIRNYHDEPDFDMEELMAMLMNNK